MNTKASLLTFQQLLFLSLLFIFPSLLPGQVYINEICSVNQNSFVNNSGDTPDWIEFYNAGNETINLEAYYLSDGESDFLKWQFPSINISPNEYLLVFASGDDISQNEIHTNFKLANTGEILTFSSPTKQIIQQILVPALIEDVSYARLPEADFFYCHTPSPQAENNSNLFISPAKKPLFSKLDASFVEHFILELDCLEPNCQIYYSIDGSNSKESGILYTSPIEITENTIIRAHTEAEGYLPSPVYSMNYFSSQAHELPIIALSTNPDNLFAYENGIFETGPDAEENHPFWGANYWKDIEIPVHIEFLEGDFSRLSSFNLGARTHGGRGTRTHPQKALRLLAEHQYGDNKINYKIFPDRQNTSFERIVLRNAGGDFNHSNCRDEFLARYLLKENLDLDIITYQPAAWYVNGKYWGIIALREKFDAYWLEQNYGIPTNQIDLLEEDTITVVGNRDIFEEDYAFIKENNLENDQVFAQAALKFDVKNIVDYWVAQTTIINSNWPHNNLKLWREKVSNGKWRYMTFDMDVSMNRWPWTALEINILKEKLDNDRFVEHTDIFVSLLKNKNYREYFINRYADLLNTTFRPKIWSQAVQDMQSEISPEMQRHFARWNACQNCNSFDFWETIAMPNMIDFSERRAPFARQNVKEYFSLKNEVKLDIRSYPEDAGKIQVNTITPEHLPWDGYYFNGVPVELTIIPNQGYTFQHWQSLHTITSPNAAQSIKVNFSEDDSITAYFSANYNGLNTEIYPNPTSGLSNFTFTLERNSDVKITIFAADGKELQVTLSSRLTGGTHYIPIDFSDFIPGIYFASIKTDSENQTVKIIVK